MEANLNDSYWSERYKAGQTGWDIGQASPPLIDYCKGIEDKAIAMLIPGRANAYEAKALLDLGFSNVTLLDISAELVQQLKNRFAEFPGIRVLHEDFFDHNGVYDLILEQTFFCALDPSLRNKYVVKQRSLLKPKGKIAGVLFNAHFEKDGPPFGGDEKEYRSLFSEHFKILTMENSKNSIAPRMGSELFFELENF